MCVRFVLARCGGLPRLGLGVDLKGLALCRGHGRRGIVGRVVGKPSADFSMQLIDASDITHTPCSFTFSCGMLMCWGSKAAVR